MTTSDPERPPQPFGGTEYPSLENSAPQPDPYAPVDYPADAGVAAADLPAAVSRCGGLPRLSGLLPGGTTRTGRPSHPARTARRSRRWSRRWSGLVCCGLPSIVGLILGVIAMRETKRTGQDGYAMALIGAIIGGLAVAGWVLYLLLSIGIYASGWHAPAARARRS